MERDRKAYHEKGLLKTTFERLKALHQDEPEIIAELKETYIALTAGGEEQTDFRTATAKLAQISSQGKTNPRQLSLKGFWEKGK